MDVTDQEESGGVEDFDTIFPFHSEVKTGRNTHSVAGSLPQIPVILQFQKVRYLYRKEFSWRGASSLRRKCLVRYLFQGERGGPLQVLQ